MSCIADVQKGCLPVMCVMQGLVEPDHAPPRDFMKARADAVQRQFDMHLPPMALEKKKITERLVLQKQQQGRKHDLVLLAKLEAGNTEKLAAQLPPMPPPVKNQVKPMQPPSAKPCAVNTTGIPDKDSIGERNRDPSSQSWHSLGDVVSDIKDKSSKVRLPLAPLSIAFLCRCFTV